MKTNPIRFWAYILTALFWISSLAACHATPPAAPPTNAPTASTAPTSRALSVGYDRFSGRFNPFFARTPNDREAVSLVTLSLLDTDREGNVVLNGHNGIANGTVTENEDGTVTYDFTLRDDVKFSDGETLTADDVIFSMYVLADPSYDGPSAFSSLPIKGLAEYRTGVSPVLYEKYAAVADKIRAAGPDATAYDGFTEAQYTAYWGDVLAAAGEMFVGEIVAYCLQNYAEFLPRCGNNDVVLGMYVWGYGSLNEDGSFTDAFGTVYDLRSAFPTKADFWQCILTAHNRDLSADGIDRDAVATPIADLLETAFVTAEGPKDENVEELVHTVAGIEKTGDFSVRVTLTTADAAALRCLNIPVAPLHYYGADNAYDYQNNRFGFTKGDLSGVRAKTTPLGAGPFVFDSYEDGTVTLTANANYRKGCPAIETLLLKTVSDRLSALADGTVDVAAVDIREDGDIPNDGRFTVLTVDGLEEDGTDSANGGKTVVVFNTARIDASTLPADITPFWSWMREIETLKIHE